MDELASAVGRSGAAREPGTGLKEGNRRQNESARLADLPLDRLIPPGLQEALLPLHLLHGAHRPSILGRRRAVVKIREPPSLALLLHNRRKRRPARGGGAERSFDTSTRDSGDAYNRCRQRSVAASPQRSCPGAGGCETGAPGGAEYRSWQRGGLHRRSRSSSSPRGKREEPRQSVPISISAFTGDELDQAQSDWLVNGNLSYLLPDDRTEISVWVRNWGTGIHRELFRYLRVWSRQILSSRPRHYGVTVRYSF